MRDGEQSQGKPSHPPVAGRVSLARALSKLGYCSRSRALQLIRDGHVSVGGTLCRDPSLRVDIMRDRVSVDGQLVTAAERVYLMLNKPRGLVTTWADERGRPTVYQCLRDPSLPWLSPVGRLDKASEGLLLFTNDTRWAARILAPGSHVEKVYHVQVASRGDEAIVAQLLTGVADQGDLLCVTRARPLRRGSRNAWLEIALEEGKNRQIRRMFAALDIDVLRLVRVAIGPLELGDLRKGAYRLLTKAERDALS